MLIVSILTNLTLKIHMIIDNLCHRMIILDRAERLSCSNNTINLQYKN
jgi:hypothetical protein